MLESGMVVEERYRVVRPLGEGGMGAVYRAWDLRLKVPVALKELRPQPGLESATLVGLRTQFEQEAAVLARLNHPNLVRVTDYFEEQGNAYLVMDFVEGRSLADVILEDGAQLESRVLDWGRQLLEALTYCHDQGVIHRDVKPQNIILRPDNRVKLVDFGLVKLWDPNDPQTRTVMRGMGTPEYAPPEQYGATTDHTGPQSDVYSLGATLYHLLTGQAPPTATERMAMPSQFVPLRYLAPQVTPRVEHVVMKALQLPVQERWQSAREMWSAIQSGPLPPMAVKAPMSRTTVVTPSMPPVAGSAPPPSWVAPPARKPRRGLWIGIAAVVLVCAAVSCVGVVVGMPWVSDWMAAGDAPTVTPAVDPLVTVVRPTATPVRPTATTAPPTATRVAPSPTRTPEPSGDGFEVTIQNWSPYDVCYVFISPSTAESWGDDWLGEQTMIAPEARQSFSVPAGPHDIEVLTCDEGVMATAWEISHDLALEISAPDLVPIWVINDLDTEVCFLYASPEVSDEWGPDRMGEYEGLVPGDVRIIFVTPEILDVMAEDCDGNIVAEVYGIFPEPEYIWLLSDNRVEP